MTFLCIKITYSMNFLNKTFGTQKKADNSVNKLLILYLIFCFIILLLNFYFSYLYTNKFPEIVDANNQIILENLGFNFGQILSNLQIGEGLKANYFGTDYYVSRMPLLPLTLNFLYNYISENFFIIHLIKNLFFFTIIFILLTSYKKDKKILFIVLSLLLFLYNPHNLITSLSFNFEEGILNYLIIILILLFLSDINLRFLYISIVISLIFFLKSSMIFFCTALCIFFLFSGYRKVKFYYLPLIFLIFSNLVWGSYSYKKTGFFAYGTNLASYNSFTLNHAYNDKFTKLYPKLSPDILSKEIEKKLPSNITRNEWEIDKFYFDESIKYLKSNPKDVLIGVIKKFQVVFLYLNKDSQFPDEAGQLKYELRLSNIPNKAFFIAYLFLILKNFFFKRDSKNLFFIIATIFYFFPYFVGFIYTRHCTSFYMIATFYIFNEYFYKNILSFIKKN